MLHKHTMNIIKSNHIAVCHFYSRARNNIIRPEWITTNDPINVIQI